MAAATQHLLSHDLITRAPKKPKPNPQPKPKPNPNPNPKPAPKPEPVLSLALTLTRRVHGDLFPMAPAWNAPVLRLSNLGHTG